MTPTAFVAVGIVLIAFVVYLALEQRGQDVHFYYEGTSIGDASGEDLRSSDTSLLSIMGITHPDPSRPGERRVTYTLLPVDQSPRYRLNGGSTIQATHGHALDFVDGTCMTNGLVGDGSGGVRLTSTMDCTFAPTAHGSHDTAFYYGGTSAGDATGVDITSAGASLLTVGGAVATDSLRTGENRMTYTLTSQDPSPEYEVGASNIQATYPYDVDFRPGTCISQTLGGTASNVEVTTNLDTTATGCMFAPVVHTHPPTLIDRWTLSCGGSPAGMPVQRCDFQFESNNPPRLNALTATRNTFRDFSDDLAFAATGDYMLTLKLELHFTTPIGNYLPGSGTCPSGKTLTTSTAVAVSPSPLANSTPIYVSSFVQGNAVAMPATNPYCEDDGGTPNTIPDRAADVMLDNWILTSGNYIFDLYDQDGPDYLLTDETITHRNIGIGEGMVGRYEPARHFVGATLITDVSQVSDVLEFGLDELGGDATLDRTRTKLHVVVLRVSPQ